MLTVNPQIIFNKYSMIRRIILTKYNTKITVEHKLDISSLILTIIAQEGIRNFIKVKLEFTYLGINKENEKNLQ